MAVGLAMNRLMKLVHLPNVTGYLIAGLVIGPCIGKIFSTEMLASCDIIVTVALGFIAFSIGGEFKLSNIRQIGGKVLVITFFQALTATLFVTLAELAFGFPLPLALVLGAIATATAPAATLMVVRQYRAHGPVTNILLPAVALDDAIGLIVFSVCMALARVMVAKTGFSVGAALLEPLREIGLSLAVGAAIGALLSFVLRFFHSNANRGCVMIAAVVAATALAERFDLSSLLTCMMVGAVMANMYQEYDKIMQLAEDWTPPLFMLFFVLSGAEIDLAVIPTVGLLGVVYILARAAGKYLGAFTGSALVGADRNIRLHLGITLLPQAGVAIGMSQVVTASLPEYGTEIKAVVLCATMIYELVGPVLTKMSLTKAGEIQKAVK